MHARRPFMTNEQTADRSRMLIVCELYELIAAGEIETLKLGKSTRITTASLHDLVRRQRGAT